MHKTPAFDIDEYMEWLAFRASAGSSGETRRFITISREYGCEGYAVARTLRDLIEESHPNDPWLVFSHPMMEKLVSDETMGVELIDSISERRYSFVNWFIDGIVPEYLMSPQSKTFERLRTLILNLAEKGNCIVLGGGSQIITQKLSEEKFSAAHFRLVAPFSFRTHKVMENEGITEEEAEKEVKNKEFARNRFVEDFTGISSTDPTLYHLIFNNEKNRPDKIAKTAHHYLEDRHFFTSG